MAYTFLGGDSSPCVLCGYPAAWPSATLYGGGLAHSRCIDWRAANAAKEAPRGELPKRVVRAVRTIHRAMWRTPYTPGEGPMHYASGPYWHDELMRQADRWEEMAKAARIAATALPERDRFARGDEA